MTLAFYRLGAVWLALMLATGLTAWLAGLGADQSWATCTILAVAAVKVALVMSWFMELHNAPRPWQIAFATWWLAVSALVLGAFTLT